MGIEPELAEGRFVVNYISGDWEREDNAVGEQVVDSATGRVVADVPFASPDTVDRAVADARSAFEDWSQRPVEERVQPLFELKHLLETHQEEVAETMVEEHGKTFDEAMGEVRRGIENVEVATGMPTLLQGGHVSNAAPNIDETAVRKPLGVFAAITPFNFPGMIPLWFLPYAVGAGNTFVLKPSEKTPLTANLLLQLIEEAGFPDGVVNMVVGGPETVNTLLEHEDVEGISFVGSTPVAKHVYETAAKHGKRVQAQGGANNFVVVAPSADLEFAAEQTINSSMANSGQRCLANPNAVVAEAVYDEFVDHLLDVAREYTVASGMDEDADMGPLISEDHLETVEEYIETGVEEGATLLLDGREREFPEESDDGFFIGPTIFSDVTPDMTIVEEEIFGPVLSVFEVSDLDEAFGLLNDDRYGNAASLFTTKGRDAKRFRHEVDAGNLGVNIGTAAPMAFFHFGGWDDSFFGDLHGQDEDVVRFYTDEAVYIERWPEDTA
ncbi:MAG: CoA-acylating methylmalonate-semialdehyde dehydrogenase [Halodesulfurarchaeum sp.]